jgi:phosphatidylglycerophosphatase C
MTEQVRTVAAFDFDGTITRSDTLIPFLRRSVGSARTARALLALSVRITRSMAGAGSRDAAKEELLRRLLAGQPVAALEAVAESFADHLVAYGLRSETLERIAFHHAAGHELVVVSASPEIYVAPVARRLGFTAALGTRLEVGPDGRLTGRLVGPNCRGPEKVRRLEEWLGEEACTVVAYGDSRGDRELLAFAGDGAVRMARRRRPRRYSS